MKSENVYRQEARRFLREILTLDTKCRINLLEQEAAANRAQGCSSISVGIKVQTSPKGDAMALAIAELVELKEEYEELLTELIGRQKMAKAIIGQISKKTYQNVLRLRYFSGVYRIDDIATELHYDPVYVRRLHQEALDAFGKILIKS